MRRHTEGIAHGDAVPSEAFLQIFRKEQAASALGRGCQDHTVPETETVPDGKFCRAHKYAFSLIETSENVLVGAAELAVRHRFSFWDGVVLASAAEGGCRLLLSEDLQEGFTWNGVTVSNPFGVSPHPLLTDLLR